MTTSTSLDSWNTSRACWLRASSDCCIQDAPSPPRIRSPGVRIGVCTNLTRGAGGGLTSIRVSVSLNDHRTRAPSGDVMTLLTASRYGLPSGHNTEDGTSTVADTRVSLSERAPWLPPSPCAALMAMPKARAPAHDPVPQGGLEAPSSSPSFVHPPAGTPAWDDALLLVAPLAHLYTAAKRKPHNP
jgi:hypothetical protein